MSEILATDAHVAETGEVIVASTLLGATSLDDVEDKSDMTCHHQGGEDPWIEIDPEDYADVRLIDHGGESENLSEQNLTECVLDSHRVGSSIQVPSSVPPVEIPGDFLPSPYAWLSLRELTPRHSV